MNTKNMLKVADLIEQHPQQFDMTVPFRVNIHNCGTSGCIGGFARSLLIRDTTNLARAGEQVFGLTLSQAHGLFYGGSIWTKYADEFELPVSPDGRFVNIMLIEAHHAVTMLRNLASGKWSF